jgi:hypothetical protein
MEYLLDELGSEMCDHTQGREEVAGTQASLQDIISSDIPFKDKLLAFISPLGVLLVLNSHPFRWRGFNPNHSFRLSKLFVNEHLRVPKLCHQPISFLLQEELILGKIFHLDTSFRTLGNILLLFH